MLLNNNQLSGTIPDSISTIASLAFWACNNGSASVPCLSLYNNSLVGAIPPSLRGAPVGPISTPDGPFPFGPLDDNCLTDCSYPRQPWCVAPCAIDPVDRAALVDIFIGTNGIGWERGTGWSAYADSSNDPCSPRWFGVTCSASNSSNTTHVV